MKSERASRPQNPNPLLIAFAWLWVIGVLAAYIHGFADIIRLLSRAFFGVET